MSKITFEWHERKNKANKRKHKVSFEEAKTCFYDENGKLIHDPDHSEKEDRFVLLAVSERARILAVCHCYREDDSIVRIISVRKAMKGETKEYKGGLK